MSDIDLKRIKFFLHSAVQAVEHMEMDNPKAFESQAGGWLLRDLAFMAESFGAPKVDRPDTAKQLYDAVERWFEDEIGWPCGEHSLHLAQVLFGAVMPTSMFYTSWPAEYYDMMEVANTLDKRPKPEALKFMIDAIYEKIDRDEAAKKTEEQA